jgi:hypothetical protein
MSITTSYNRFLRIPFFLLILQRLPNFFSISTIPFRIDRRFFFGRSFNESTDRKRSTIVTNWDSERFLA